MGTVIYTEICLTLGITNKVIPLILRVINDRCTKLLKQNDMLVSILNRSYKARPLI